MAEVYEQHAFQILQNCSEALQKQQSRLPKQTTIFNSHSKNKCQAKQLLFSTLNACITPHEESQNNKIIQKLRRKNNKKRELKEVVIRKTDLGENQLIFTKEELQRLKEVDNQEIYGISSSKSPSVPNLFQDIANVISPEQANKKYFSNQISDNPHQQILNYLDWVDLKDIKSNKDKKKNKILNFQKRQKCSSSSLESINKKIINQLPILMPKHSSPFRILKNLELNKAKSCYPLIKKNSVDKGFLNSINSNDVKEERRVSQKQKMNEIIFKVNQKIEKQLSSSQSSKQFIYMTQERKQALFECELLRKVKRQIGPKFYNNLQLSYGNQLYQQNEQTDSNYDKQNDSKSHFHNKSNSVEGSNLKKNKNWNGCQNSKQKNYIGLKQKNVFETQAQKMIHKNRNRLKDERKRVIQKIVC